MSKNKLIARLLTGAALLAGMGGTALADGASIELTGPGSTNIVDVHSATLVGLANSNMVGTGNWNWQHAHSGNVRFNFNTLVNGGGFGSGSAFNSNNGENFVNIENSGGFGGFGVGFGNSLGSGTIFLTGPGSFNRISSNNFNRFTQTNRNQVMAANVSNQVASTGNLVITGNTLVTGVGGTGSAVNENSGSNTVNIENSTPFVATPLVGMGGSAGISTTGPFSNNQIRLSSGSTTTLTNTNNVSTVNFNSQTARSGNVTISGNTVVSGVGGSGDALNTNMGQNDVGITNN